MADCPSSSTWVDLARGALATEAAAAAEAHLSGCGACAAQVLRELRLALATITLPASRTFDSREGGPADPSLRGDDGPRYHPVSDEHGGPVELGRGGIGRVMLVTDSRLGRDVAMKLLLPAQELGGDTRQSAGVAARFLREARVTGQLEHPAIVPVHDLGQRPDGRLFYTMRRIRGRTLAQALAQAASLEARLALMPHLLAACQAVAFAHSRRVVHRDLKPQNVMLDRYGETYVVDWGLARVLDQEEPAPEVGTPPDATVTPQVSQVRMAPDLTSAEGRAVVGTPAYMSPEQLEGRVDDVDERSDVWGLGAVLFEVLTGTLPREAVTGADGRWHFGAVRPVLALEPRAPRELAAVCEKALAADKARRYATAEQLAADVDAWVHGRQVKAYAYRPLDLLRRFVRQYRAPLAVAAAALVLTAGLGVRSWWRVQQERNDARRLADLLLGDVAEQLKPTAGALPVVKAVTDRALEFYQRIGSEEGYSPEERGRMAMGINRIAQLNLKLGRFDEAARLADSCITFVGSGAAGGTPQRPLYVAGVACRVTLGNVRSLRSDDAASRAAIADAQAWVDRAPPWDDTDWLKQKSVLASQHFQLAYAGNDLQAAKAVALEEVALDEKILARTPKERLPTVMLASSLLDLQLASLYADDFAKARDVGERAIALLEGLAGASSDTTVLGTLAAARTQQYQVCQYAGDHACTTEQLTKARRVYERLLEAEPDSVIVLGDYGTLLLRAGDVQAAYAPMKRADALGARAGYEPSFMQVCLLLGRLDEVLARRAALEADGSHQSLWVLAVALAASGKPGEAAEAARRAQKDTAPRAEWPPGALQRYAQTLPGPTGRAIERFADAYEAQFLKPAGEQDWSAVLLDFASALDALAGADGGTPQGR